jgi:hypothetical protein
MFEDAMTKALGNFNETLIGSVLVAYVVLSFFGFRFMRTLLAESRAELKETREELQAVRNDQLADIRNFAHVGNAVEALSRTVDRLQSTVIETAGRNRP